MGEMGLNPGERKQLQRLTGQLGSNQFRAQFFNKGETENDDDNPSIYIQNKHL